jgi:anthranilate synthase component I
MTRYIPDRETFKKLVEASTKTGCNVIPVCARVMDDQTTPVLAYRRLVRPDERMAPSFLFESVVGGDRIGRYSFLGAQPSAQVIARGQNVEFIDHATPSKSRNFVSKDPLSEVYNLTKTWKLAKLTGLPDFTGGWVGYAAYDSVRYLEGEKLPNTPKDDRNLPDVHLCLYNSLVAFDHVQKAVLLITNVLTDNITSADRAYDEACQRIEALIQRVEALPDVKVGLPELPVGRIDLTTPAPKLPVSNMGAGGYQAAVVKAKEFIAAGDIFQVVPSQRFEIKTTVDPFEVYRSLRVVNPSPYMFYLQAQGCILVGSSPEILCSVQNGVVTNRPLAGTRKRGATPEEDIALEKDLLADPKERAEHIMLVDLGRNDVGRVSEYGSVRLPAVMQIERYSHVMHISSTVTGKLQKEMTCWDALKHALPVGTVSGAPKVRAMQIIDDLEPTKRGPYAGAVGYADFAGNMDMAIALRTMVVLKDESTPGGWTIHLQAGGGIVADSDPDAEHQETVNKAAALAKAIDMAERAFGKKSAQ